MSIVSKAIDYNQDQDVIDHLINFKRPYNVEKRNLQSNVNFGVISQYLADRCLEEALDKDHRLALKMNKELEEVTTALDELYSWSINNGVNKESVLETVKVIENYLGVRK